MGNRPVPDGNLPEQHQLSGKSGQKLRIRLAPFRVFADIAHCNMGRFQMVHPLYRNQVKTTAYEYLEQRFALWARVYIGTAYILLQIGRFAVVLYLTALAMAALLDIDIKLLILALGLLTIIYTLMGGFAAVIWTDVVQAVVLFFGGLLCLYILLADMPGAGRSWRR